ncbi:MAG TPA: hypothetical protein VGO62_19830 [Myxococcota bacterium]
MRSIIPIVTVLCAAALTSPGARAQDDLSGIFFGQKPKPFIDPAGYYAAILPTGFDCEAKARHVQCKGNRGVEALLTIDVVDVPASASADIAMLNQMDKFKQKPHFKLLQKGAIKVDKSPATLVDFSYDYLGNVEYSVGVEELIMVRSGKLYLVHEEMRLDQLGVHKKDLQQLYASFKPARVDAGGNPVVEDLKPPTPKSDTPEIDKALTGRY